MTSETVRSDPARLASFEPGDTFDERVPRSSIADRNRSAAMLVLAPEALERAMRREIEIEHDLPDAVRYPAVLGRLRAWLALDGESARVLARAHEAALATFPGEYTARRNETESAVMRNGMSFDEFRTLAELLPWMGGDAALDVFAAALDDLPAVSATGAAAAPPRPVERM